MRLSVGYFRTILHSFWEKSNSRRFAFYAIGFSIALSILHYWFGEWVFHPHLNFWMKAPFWRDLPLHVAMPLLLWLVWSYISRRRLSPVSIILQGYIILIIGDFLASATERNIALFAVKTSPDYWYWWTYWEEAVVCGICLALLKKWLVAFDFFGSKKSQPTGKRVPVIRLAAFVLAFWLLLLVLAYAVIPRLGVNDVTSQTAEWLLVKNRDRENFQSLLELGDSKRNRIGVLLDHLRLAQSVRGQFYDSLEPVLFRSYVLSPEITSLHLPEWDWRPTLWKNLHSRIADTHDPVAGAQSVVLFLREHVGIDPDYSSKVGVETIWAQRMTDAAGFGRIYVAALRSVGIAARFNENEEVELWTGTAWQKAPSPPILTLAQP